jgi:hypothetical protein
MLLRDSIEISCKPGGSRIVRPNRKMHAEAPWDVYIWVNDLFALHKELQSKGAKVIRGPEETFSTPARSSSKTATATCCASAKTLRLNLL